MRLGIDFGTTRTVVAVSDRGNYPVVSFAAPGGESREFFPSVVAECDGELKFGFAALEQRAKPGWTLCRSFKRWLTAPGATPDYLLRVGSCELTSLDLITRYLQALREALLNSSNLTLSAPDRRLQATIATPAGAFSTQRLVTLEAFRRAGFDVLSMLNEPSAAGVEYAHRYRNTFNSRREKVLVYDLGGGTFDVSLVDMRDQCHDVVISRGLARLGGDDFDQALVEVTLSQAGLNAEGLSTDALSAASVAELKQHCRELKEALHPNTRKIHVELGRCLDAVDRKKFGMADGDVTIVPSEAYDASCMTLMQRTLELVQLTLQHSQASNTAPATASGDEATRGIAGLYVVGGASALPAVARSLKALYGHRVRRSPYPSAAIAIGLAIAADTQAQYDLKKRFHHNLGVFREIEGGAQIGFDRIIGPDTSVPAPGQRPLELSRRYRATHNVGHFRFVECGWLDDRGEPSGDIKPFTDVLFPFDRQLRDEDDLRQVAVARSPQEGPEIEERYSISEHGAVRLTIVDRESGYERNYQIAG